MMPYPPFSKPDPARRPNPVSQQLPSIEQFVDDLPSIDEFRMEAEHSQTVGDPFAPQEEGWAAGDWQSYDWGAVAALGTQGPEAREAQAAWSSTDWDSGPSVASKPTGSPRGLQGREVAAALDEFARRIRSGELSLERFSDMPPEAAIAAVFAAFLRTRG